jgi:hypothetical protein
VPLRPQSALPLVEFELPPHAIAIAETDAMKPIQRQARAVMGYLTWPTFRADRGLKTSHERVGARGRGRFTDRTLRPRSITGHRSIGKNGVIDAPAST